MALVTTLIGSSKPRAKLQLQERRFKYQAGQMKLLRKLLKCRRQRCVYHKGISAAAARRRRNEHVLKTKVKELQVQVQGLQSELKSSSRMTKHRLICRHTASNSRNE